MVNVPHHKHIDWGECWVIVNVLHNVKENIFYVSLICIGLYHITY